MMNKYSIKRIRNLKYYKIQILNREVWTVFKMSFIQLPTNRL